VVSSTVQEYVFSRPYLVRYYGRAYATGLRPSVVVCTECKVAKRCEQKLLLTAYRKSHEKSIGTKMNDLDLGLEVVSRSCQPLRHIRRWIWFPRTTNRKWPTGNQMVTWPMTSRDHERSNSWPEYALSAISWKKLEMLYLATIANYYVVYCDAVRSTKTPKQSQAQHFPILCNIRIGQSCVHSMVFTN